MKYLLSLMMIIISTNIYSQSDSSYHVSLLSQFSIDKASANGVSYSVYSAEAIIKKMKYTIVPTYRNKTLQNMKGNQYGVSLYRSFKKSYLNVDVAYSADMLFPTWNLHTDYFQSIAKGLEFRVAYNYRSYDVGEVNHMAIMGVSYESHRVIIHYNAYNAFGQSLSHQFSLRRNLKMPRDYLQISYTNGKDDTMRNVDNVDNQNSTYRLSLGKNVMKIINLIMTAAISDFTHKDTSTLNVGYMVGIGIDLH